MQLVGKSIDAYVIKDVRVEPGDHDGQGKAEGQREGEGTGIREAVRACDATADLNAATGPCPIWCLEHHRWPAPDPSHRYDRVSSLSVILLGPSDPPTLRFLSGNHVNVLTRPLRPSGSCPATNATEEIAACMNS